MRVITLPVAVLLCLAESAAASAHKFICSTLLSHAGDDGSIHKVRRARDGFFLFNHQIATIGAHILLA